MRVSPKFNIAGHRFGRWMVISWRKDHVRRHGFLWLCRCDCGNSREVRTDQLTFGKSKSCGCLKSELVAARFTKHGASRTLTYSTWISMIARCTDPKNDNFKNYGGRGISVCNQWFDFHRFAKDVGIRPSRQHTIDRINNDGHYEPGNVRWATGVLQGNNRRTNHLVTFNGETASATTMARNCGMNPMTVLGRLGDGWSDNRALTEPVAPPTNPSGRSCKNSTATPQPTTTA